MGLFTLIMAIFLLTFILQIWFTIRIIHKAGYSAWWFLPAVIPGVGIFMVWLFAFADWPALKTKNIAEEE